MVTEIRPPIGTPVFHVSGHSSVQVTRYANIAMRTGQPRRRAVFTSTPRVVSVVWLLESAQMAAVDAWFEDTLLAGEREFAAQVKGIGYQAGPDGMLWFTARWVEPYQAEAMHLGRWRVTGQLHLTGEGGTTDPYSPNLVAEYGASLLASASLSVMPLFEAEVGAALSRTFNVFVEYRFNLQTRMEFTTEYGAALEGEVTNGS